ncbi:hypothetical protein Q5Y75_23875 [Ruegeria sp. 2205SS24-7]|uniref:hypothetical protein n=1 Tax=Ruegeria discodermiae TaxID=3064389 RepID=UPI00274260CD|nr:hypothetical protein [Ruegeria sp. 2205SS24-7]MDP5220233.1 hypothetical protein [Ruegeria sp. 2205SS24-7]
MPNNNDNKKDKGAEEKVELPSDYMDWGEALAPHYGVSLSEGGDPQQDQHQGTDRDDNEDIEDDKNSPPPKDHDEKEKEAGNEGDEDEDKTDTDEPEDDDPEEREAGDLREQLRQRVRDVVPENSTNEDVVPGSDPAELSGAIIQAEKLLAAIATPDLQTLRSYAERDVPTLEDEVLEIKQKVASRKHEADRIRDEEARISVPETAHDGEKRRLEEARKKVTDCLAVLPLTDEVLTKADTALTAAKKVASEIETNVNRRLENHQQISEELSGIELDAGANDEDKQAFTEARENVVSKLAETPLTDQVLTDAALALEEARKRAELIREAVQERQEVKQRIKSEAEQLEDHGDADENEKSTLAKARKKVTEKLDETPLTDQVLTDAALALAEARNRAERIREAVQKRQEEKQRIKSEAKQLENPADADKDEKSALAEAREKVANTLAETPLTDQVLTDAALALEEARKRAELIREAVQERQEVKQRIKSEAKQLEDHGDADENEKSALAEAREKVANTLAETPLSNQVLKDAASALEKARELAERIQQAAQKRQEEKQRIKSEAEQLEDHGDADGNEKAALAEARNKVADKLDETPLIQTVLDDAQSLLEDAKRTALELSKAAQIRRDTHDRIQSDGEGVKIVGVLADQIEKMKTAREELASELTKPVTQENNEAAQAKLEVLQKTARNVSDELAVLGDAKGIHDLCDAAGVSHDEYLALEDGLGGRKELLACRAAFSATKLGELCKDLGGADKLGTLIKELGGAEELQKLLGELGEKDFLLKLVNDTSLDGKEIKKLCTDLEPKLVADMLGAGVSAKDIERLHAAIGDKVSDFKTLAKDAGLSAKPKAMMALFTTGCEGDSNKFQALCTGFSGGDDADKLKRANLKGLVDKGGLGDAPEAFGELLATGCDGDPAKLIELSGAFDTDEKRDGMKRMLSDGGLAGRTAPPPLADKEIDAKCLAMMLKHAAGPAPHGFADNDARRRSDALAKLFTNMDEDGCKDLRLALSDGGLGQAPEALGHAIGIGCGGDAAQLTAFAGAFKVNPGPKKLEQLLTDGGLKGKSGPLVSGDIDPKCLGQILKHGAGPTPANANTRMGKMADLINGLEKGDCETLKDVLGEGGLGQAPEPLGHLIGVGCEGAPTKLKATIGAFDDKPKREGLAKILKKGGLDSSVLGVDGRPKVDPACLAQLLKHSGGPRPDAAVDPEDSRRAKALAALCTGMGDVGFDALKEVLEDSGLGNDPVVLGHLVGIGCKGNGTKLEALTTELNKGQNKSNLTDLLQKGGLGTRDDANKPTGTDAKCLANLFEPGSDGDPAELIKLMTALSDTAANPNALSDLKGVMTTGVLGHHPEVLGSLYKHGCLDNSTGSADGAGAKDPQILIDMVGEFRGDTEAAKFNELLTAGGFAKRGKANVGGRDIHRDRLASVMRYGFTLKGGTKPDGKKLKKLYDAFKNNAGDHLGDLDSMLDAMETAEDWILEESKAKEPKQPGKGLQNVIGATGHGGNVTHLHSKFFTKLKQRATSAAVGDPAHVPRLSQDQLIQHAASFEHDTTHPPRTSVTPTGGAATEVRLNHIVERHTRKHCNFTLKPANDPVPVTLYPRGTDVTNIEGRVKGALENLANPQPLDETALGNGGTYSFEDNINDGNGGTAKIGFNKDPNSGANPQAAYVGQFYPRGGVNVRKIKNLDMLGMQDALV